MNQINLHQLVLDTLDNCRDLWLVDPKTGQKELDKRKLLSLIDEMDEGLVDLLFEKPQLKKKFFLKTKKAYIFKQIEFRFFIEQNQINNSYTQFKNKIGLTASKKFITEGTDVVLDFPFKDCVLQGNQDKEDAKRDEIFFNQILAQDEIDRLFEPKALVNWKRYDKDGEHEIKYEDYKTKNQQPLN